MTFIGKIPWQTIQVCFVGLSFGFLLGSFNSPPAVASDCIEDTVEGDQYENFLNSPSNRHSRMYGKGGADQIKGYECTDNMWGGDGPDDIQSGSGHDYAYGEEGHENPNHCNLIYTYCGQILGGPGADWLEGNAGNDRLEDDYGPDGQDLVYGNLDNDSLYTNDGDGDDVADGGNGTDFCSTNGTDIPTSC